MNLSSTTLTLGTMALVACLAPAPALAAPILGSAGAGLQNMGTPAETSSRFWDGNSWDSHSTFDGAAFNPCSAGSLANGMGCTLTAGASASAVAAGLAGGTFSLAGGQAGYQAWGQADGGADMNYGFEAAAGGAFYDFTMLGELTDDWDVNEIGWYSLDSPQVRHTIFSSSAATGSTSQVWIPTNFGFYYLNTSGNGEVFYTQSMHNTVGNRQQFASFQQGDYTVVGVEDIFSNTLTQAWTPTGGDYDFNDVMFGYRQSSVPEPGTLLLMGLGVAGAAWTRRRKAS
jgi:hypothetical protein